MLRNDRLSWILPLIAGVLYIFSAHHLATGAAPGPWHLLAGALPLTCMLVLWSLGRPWQWLMYATLAVILALLCYSTRLASQAGLWPFFIQDLCGNLFGCTLFGSSLRGPGEALVTRIARFVHPELSVTTLRYTRRVTLIWAAFFGGSAVLSSALFLSGRYEAWSWYANLLFLPAAGLLMVSEYIVRIFAIPPHERSSPAQMITAMRHLQAQRRSGT